MIKRFKKIIAAQPMNNCGEYAVERRITLENGTIEFEDPTIDILYHEDAQGRKVDPVKAHNGNFIDLEAAEDVFIPAGTRKLISLGVSIKLPQGYWAQFVPRSGLFKDGYREVIQTNSFAVIDTSYCGPNDIWKISLYAFKDTEIHFGDRICQFRIVEDIPFGINEVDHLDGKDRGGFGSTGV